MLGKRRFLRALLLISWVSALALVPFARVHAESNFGVLYYFRNNPDGAVPMAGLITSPSGNLFGTTESGGVSLGTVFEISPTGNETVLHTFNLDGVHPLAPLLMDAAGNLYGTLSNGNRKKCGRGGCVFKLAPDGTETTLHNFKKPAIDGNFPRAGLIADANGNLYGTTEFGGGKRCNQDCGTVFKISPDGTEVLLHVFGGADDGALPEGNLVFDDGGNLYGTTSARGAHGRGIVFKLAPDGTETILYSFAGGADGANPVAGLIIDSSGNLFGTTSVGAGTGCQGNEGCGAIFELSPSGVETVLYRFQGGSDGGNPGAALIADAAGNLYGTTLKGGSSGCDMDLGCGTVFKFDPTGGGSEITLHAFDRKHGYAPYGSLVIDEKGNLYGTASGNAGARSDNGIVFKIKAP